METYTKKAVLEFLKMKLSTDDRWALRALEVIYRRQTEAEKSSGGTIDANGVGFSGTDSEFLSSLAERAPRGLSPKQMKFVRKIMPRYRKQVLSVSSRETLEGNMRVAGWRNNSEYIPEGTEMERMVA